MTDKELRKLKRSDLIEILYYLSRENDELREENEKLNARLDAVLLQATAVSAKEKLPFRENGSSKDKNEQ